LGKLAQVIFKVELGATDVMMYFRGKTWRIA